MRLRKLIFMFMLIELIQNQFGYGLGYLSETIPLRLLSFRLTGVISLPFPTAKIFSFCQGQITKTVFEPETKSFVDLNDFNILKIGFNSVEDKLICCHSDFP